MKKWRVEIERKTLDVVNVEAETFEEALLKGQSNLYQIRTKATITATAVEKTPKGEQPIESAYD
jgi:hypothetical protein